MGMNKNLPIYKLTIKKDDFESGVSAIALVNEPAIEIDFFAFKNEIPKFQFKTLSEDKQQLAGYLMIPDKLIYRRDGVNEYFVTFDNPTIQMIAEKFNKNKLQSNFNTEHSASNALSNVFVMENWIVESAEFDKSKMYGFDPIIGAWFGVIKIDDTNIWNEYVKTGQVKGFSIEGNFEMAYSSMMDALFKKEVAENIYEKQATNMKMNFALQTTLEDGTNVSLTKLNIGGIISVLNTDGSTAVAPDGDYTFSDGSVVTQVDGLITSIAPAPDPDEFSSDEPQADKPAEDAPANDTPITEPVIDTPIEDVEKTDLEKQIDTLSEQFSALKISFEALQLSHTELSKQIENEKAIVNEKFNKVGAKSILEKEIQPAPLSYREEMALRLDQLRKLKAN